MVHMAYFQHFTQNMINTHMVSLQTSALMHKILTFLCTLTQTETKNYKDIENKNATVWYVQPNDNFLHIWGKSDNVLEGY